MNDIGIIGIGVMGQNLALNIESKGFNVSVYDLNQEKVNDFITLKAKGKNIEAFNTLNNFVNSLKPPRKILMMVNAGKPVDNVINNLMEYVNEDDIIIDGGNSNFKDSIRRYNELESKKIRFIGMGVSGGEEGALKGPSLMPGGSFSAWEEVKEILTSISAKVGEGTPCCDYVGEDGAGHFVKMIHNGIEYGDMQLIAETYLIMKNLLGMDHQEMSDVFAKWNEGELESYLIEITSKILTKKDTDGFPLLEKILDTAGQKGTGRWTAITSLEVGVPLTLITEAVYARNLSGLKEERIKASKLINEPEGSFDGDKVEFLKCLEKALYAAKIISYAQGYLLMRHASSEYNWKLNYGGIALIWRGGCIIRSKFLGKINEAFNNSPDLENLLLDPYFNQIINDSQDCLRKVISECVLKGIWIPAFSSALSYLDGFRSERLPANLIQAQRDYFGAHTYERIDEPRGKFFHANWNEEMNNIEGSKNADA